MIVDTHAHYDDEQFNEDREEILSGLSGKGISWVLNVGASLSGAEASVKLAAAYPQVYAAVGIHPDDAGVLECLEHGGVPEETGERTSYEEANPGSADLLDMKTADMPEGPAMAYLRRLAGEKKVLAIGEIGLDYHWMIEPPKRQQFWFRRQLALARELDLPVSIHSRDAAADTMEILKEAVKAGTRGVMHCYSYSPEQAREYIEMGLYLGIGGVVTYKNGKKLKQVVKEMPLERILLETDCPYLAPTPYRGTRNCSAYLKSVAEEIAALREISVEEVMEATEANARALFMHCSSINLQTEQRS